jgi:hypothetical protein
VIALSLISLNQLNMILSGIKQKLKNHRGNWEQNDPTADDYIKNRPFYSENTTNIIVPEIIVDFNNGNPYNDPFSIEFVAGEEYTVVWDGVEYKCIAYIAQGPNSPSIGNGSIGDASGGNDEPFFCTVYNGTVMLFSSDYNEHRISIFTATNIVHQIDPKYVPMPEGIVTESDVYDIVNDGMNYFHENLSNAAWSGDYNDLNNIPNVAEVSYVDSVASTKITAPTIPVVGRVLTINSVKEDGTVTSDGIDLIEDIYEDAFTPVENGGSITYNGRTFNYVCDVPYSNGAIYRFFIQDGRTGLISHTIRLQDDIGSDIFSGFYAVYFYEERRIRSALNGITYTTQIAINNQGKVLFYTDNTDGTICIKNAQVYKSSKVKEEYLPNTTSADEIEALKTLVGDTAVSEQINTAIAKMLPSVTTEDVGKLLCVSAEGTWVAESIPIAEGVGF